METQTSLFKIKSDKFGPKGPTVAMVANTSWSMYNFRLSLIRHLQDAGFNIIVIAPKDNFSANLIAEGVKYIPIVIDSYGTNPFSELRVILQLRKIYKSNHIDFIFHYTIKPNIYGSIAAKLAGIPSIAVTTGLGHLLSFSNKFTRFISLSMYKLAAILSKEVWFLNLADKVDFLELKLVSPDKTFILPGEGIDTDFFRPTAVKTNGQSMKFLFAGRIIWDKGFKEFIEAAAIIKAKYPHCEFDVVGFVDPSNPNAVPYDYILQQQAKGLIKFHGETSDIRYYLQRAHCLVFPSVYREGKSRIIMEAASMETPVITTDNVGCISLVEHNKTGFGVCSNDFQELIDAMEKFLNLPYETRLLMGKLAREKMIKQHFHHKINEIYRRKLKDFLSV